ncbi:MAG TPA: hypothetical protein VJ861_00765 [Treponemataceae bacterium]|nr:hypothetical protein [Treponemataceae bacterium]
MKDWVDQINSTSKDSFEIGLIWSKNNSLQQIANEIITKLIDCEFDYIASVEMKGVIYSAAVSGLLGKQLIIFHCCPR